MSSQNDPGCGCIMAFIAAVVVLIFLSYIAKNAREERENTLELEYRHQHQKMMMQHNEKMSELQLRLEMEKNAGNKGNTPEN